MCISIPNLNLLLFQCQCPKVGTACPMHTDNSTSINFNYWSNTVRIKWHVPQCMDRRAIEHDQQGPVQSFVGHACPPFFLRNRACVPLIGLYACRIDPEETPPVLGAKDTNSIRLHAYSISSSSIDTLGMETLTIWTTPKYICVHRTAYGQLQDIALPLRSHGRIDFLNYILICRLSMLQNQEKTASVHRSYIRPRLADYIYDSIVHHA